MGLLHWGICCFLVAYVRPLSAADFTVDVSQSFDGKSFVPAGKIVARIDEPFMVYMRPSLAKHSKEFQDVLQRDGFYTLRLIPDAGTPSKYLVSSVRARCLLSPGMQEQLQVHLDDNARILSLQYALHNMGDCSGGSSGAFPLWGEAGVQEAVPPVPQLAKEVPVAVVFPLTGTPVPVMEGADPGLPREVPREAGAAGEVKGAAGKGVKQPEKDERTWLQKNWLFILVGVMMVMQIMAKAADLPAEGAGAGRPAGTGGAAPAGGAGPSGGSGGRGRGGGGRRG